jgi:anti-anti-sigma factor
MDLYSSARLKDKMQELWESGSSRFIIDCGDLTYLDSSGVGVLLYAYTGTHKRSGAIWFVGIGGAVAKVIELTKLNGFLPITDSVESGVEELGPPEESSEGERIKQLKVDGTSPLFDTQGLYHKEFSIDLSQVRRLSNLIAQRAPAELQEINILEQQISELLKNAVKHGNKNDKRKKIKLWFGFSDTSARLIVEDEGEGFQELEAWNEFYRKKIECYQNQDFEGMMNYLTFRTEKSKPEDGGNAMMAAVEYWNRGVVFNEQRNAVAVKRDFRL